MLKKVFGTMLVACVISSTGLVSAQHGFDTAPQKPSSENSMMTKASMMNKSSMMTKAEVDLREGMRKLWSDHVIWTRMFIVSSVANMPEAGLNAERLLMNQQDIGQAIKPYYGDAAGDKLSALLKDHILIAADIVTAAKNGNMEAVNDGEKRWIGNADDIAIFLSTANSNWPQADLQEMLYQHLSLTKGELLARIHNDYSGDIEGFDMIYEQSLMMADTLSDGIVKQYPKKFGKK